MGCFLQKFAQISLLKKYGQKSTAFLTDLDMDTSAYSSNWSVFYTGATHSFGIFGQNKEQKPQISAIQFAL